MSNPTFDDRDAVILAERQQKRDARQGPRVGDFIIMLDGTTRRFAHNWGERGLQPAYRWNDGKVEVGSIHLDENGGASFSGGLDGIIPLARIAETDQTMEGRFWFFHHGWMKAHNGVYVTIPCRVFQETN